MKAISAVGMAALVAATWFGPAVFAQEPTIDWVRQFGALVPSFDTGQAIDGDGNVYIVGYTHGFLPGQTSAGRCDAFVCKYDADGNEDWTRQFGSSLHDYGHAIAVGPTGVHVAGSTDGTFPGQTSAGYADAFVRTYNGAGSELSTWQFGTTADDSAWGVSAVGSVVCIAGQTEGVFPGQSGGGGPDAFVIKLTFPVANEPPVITCNGPVVLWSPDHELVDVSSAFSVTDPDEDEVTLSFRVISDEPEIPDTGDGTGRHAPDFKTQLACGDAGLFVRSERRGAEDGRFYVFVITAGDGNGGVTTQVCVLAVCPHDQNDPQSLDDVLAQAEVAAFDVEAVVDDLLLVLPGDPLPDAINHLYEHGVSEELGPKQ